MICVPFLIDILRTRMMTTWMVAILDSVVLLSLSSIGGKAGLDRDLCNTFERSCEGLGDYMDFKFF